MSIKQLIKNYYNLDFKGKASIGGKISIISNLCVAFFKMIMGIFTASIFLFISAFYSVGCGVGRLTYFIGISKSKTEKDELKYYFRISIILFFTSVLYIVYMIRLFFIPSNSHYSSIVGIALSTISVWEMFFAIRGLIKSHKNNDLLLSGLKAISVATALLSIVLAQIAILSFTLPDVDCSFYNAIAGTFFGGICIMISIAMFYRYIRHKRRLVDKIKN
jgi:membrane protein